MLSMPDAVEFTKELAGVIRDHVWKAFRPLADRIGATEKRLDAIRQIPDDFDASIKALVRAEVAKAVSAIASDDGAIERAAKAAVTHAMTELTPPPARKDADPAEVAAILLPQLMDAATRSAVECIEKAVALIPVVKDGKPGKDADPAAMEQAVQEAVARAVSELPAPAPGKDADPAEVAALILPQIDKSVCDKVEKILAEWPKPRDGQDGVSVSFDAVLPSLIEVAQAKAVEVAQKAVAEFQQPKDGEPGKSVEIADVIDELRESARSAAAETAFKVLSEWPRPKDGEPGKDAFGTRPLDGIDETRSYPRGACAFHDGCFILAERATGPVIGGNLESAGWKVVFGTPLDFRVEQDADLRTFRFITHTRGGKQIVAEYRIPTAIYRGGWKEGKYSAGDMLTRHGNVYAAKVDTATEPGQSTDWQLAVQKGRDADRGNAQPKGPVHLK